MQGFDWNDLRLMLALHRAGSLAGAGRLLGVDATTVARRLRAVEARLGAGIFERDAEGVLRATAAGTAALEHAERAELAVEGFVDALSGMDAAISGTVRVTSVPVLLGRVLVPALAELASVHPALHLELLAEPRALRIAQREADLAVRLARPAEDAGQAVLARRIGTLAYAAYAPAGHAAPEALPWLDYVAEMAELPQARWMARRVGAGEALATMAFNDAETILQAVLAGHGRSLLPRAIADGIAGLERLAIDAALPVREIWLLAHPERRKLARVAAVAAWLERVIARLPA